MSNAQLVLVINCGSSSIKYQLFEMNDRHVLASGLLEWLADGEARLRSRRRDQHAAWVEQTSHQMLADHGQGLAMIAQSLQECKALSEDESLCGVGHRVVHGGDRFQQPTLIDSDVVEGIRDNIPLAPLHNPANLMGIEVTLKQLPTVPQVAVFDTAFHHTLPPHACSYALPQQLCEQYRVRRYGFHGTSHAYVARRAADLLRRPLTDLKLITLHLGNGASAAAIEGGRCIDTSMGMTPLEGLVMGTRSGDLDPAIPFYLAREAGMGLDEMDAMLNKQSGLLGIAGVSDMREILVRSERGDDRASLALDLFCYRIKKYIGAYIAALGGVDAIVFTGGIGEHAAEVRRRVCVGLDALGVRLDEKQNSAAGGDGNEGFIVHQCPAGVAVMVIPTNEELEIALQTVATIQAGQASS